MLTDFEKEKVFWTRKMNLRLVNFIESKPHIWNPKHSKYTSVELRDRTYGQFAAKYGNQFTGQAVKDRWTNIRSTFASYLRKLRARCLKGENYKVNWHLWDACQFLLSVKRLNTTKYEEHSGNEDFETKEDPMLSDDQDYINDDKLLDNNPTNRKITCKSIAQELVTVFQGVQNDAFGIEDSRNSKIGRTVSKKLAEMNSYDAAIISAKIMEVLYIYDDNNPNNPNNYKSDCV